MTRARFLFTPLDKTELAEREYAHEFEGCGEKGTGVR